MNSDDEPNTMADAKRTEVLVIEPRAQNLISDRVCSAVLVRMPVEVVSFYEEPQE